MKDENRSWKKGVRIAILAYATHLFGGSWEAGSNYVQRAENNSHSVYQDMYLVPANERGISGLEIKSK